ncbi:MAG: EI24 domain-containing protein [Bacteroidia bacterium]|nr:EI24 domain-containing protein [Bacteroidia bacterium]
MLKGFNFQDFISQVISSIAVMKKVLPFIKENKLWQGFFESKWISLFSIVIGILFSYYLFKDVIQLFFISSDPPQDVLQASLGADLENVKETVKREGKFALTSGGSKYLLIILLEIIIFHFAVKTLSILRNQNVKPGFTEFMNAEIRMIHVMIRNFVKGIIALVIINIILGIAGLGNYKAFMMFFVHAYFIGYAFLDNYNEQFSKSIPDSQLIIRQHVGASTAIGVIATALLYIPVIGPVLTPILGGIAATLYGHEYALEFATNEMTENEKTA